MARGPRSLVIAGAALLLLATSTQAQDHAPSSPTATPRSPQATTATASPTPASPATGSTSTGSTSAASASLTARQRPRAEQTRGDRARPGRPAASAPSGSAPTLSAPVATATIGGQAAPEPTRLERPTVTRWAPASGRDCHEFHGRRMCEGPRRVPLLEGDALRRAEGLGLIGGRVARSVTAGPAPEAWVEAAQRGGAAAPTDLLWPVPEGRLWRGYGPRQGFRRTSRGLVRTRRRHMHEGVDIGAREGSVIVSVADGLVAYSDNRMSGYGNAVLIVHADGAVSLYAHCSETYVVAGQQVRRGQVIAAVGQTGIAHGAHLHFEYRERGHTVDPQRRFTDIPSLPPLSQRRDVDTRLEHGEAEEPRLAAVEHEPPTDTDHDAEP